MFMAKREPHSCDDRETVEIFDGKPFEILGRAINFPLLAVLDRCGAHTRIDLTDAESSERSAVLRKGNKDHREAWGLKIR